jgi:hypothetical protein
MVKKGKKPGNRPKTNKLNIMKGVGKYSKTVHKIKGKGGYAEDIGSSIGSWLGKKAGSLFKSITGLGVYSVTKNSLVSNPNDPPVLSNTSGGTRIQHREYITDVTGSVGFNLTAYAINPGVAATFPWLSGVAQNFEEYILHGMVFEFKSTSATALNSTNTALGTVIMATQYNVVNPNFTAKRDMENYVYSTSSPPAVSALHPIECARDINVLSELFVRNTIPVSGTDLRFTDIGKFQIATVGMQAAANIGELWVTYDIELIKPKLPSAYTSIGPAHYVYDATSGTPPFGTAPTATDLFGVSGSKLVLHGTGNTPVTLSTNTITFTAPGRYLVLAQWVGNAATVNGGTQTLSASVTAANIIYQSGLLGNFMTGPQNLFAGTQQFMFGLTYDVSSAMSTVPATVTYAGLVLPANVTTMQLWIIPLPVGFTFREPTDIERLTTQINTLTRQVAHLHVEMEDDDFKEITDEVPEGASRVLKSPGHQLSNSQIYRTAADIVSQAIISRVATPMGSSQNRLPNP